MEQKKQFNLRTEENTNNDIFLELELSKIELFTLIVNIYEKMLFDRTRDCLGSIFIPNLYKIMISNNKKVLLYYIYFFLKYTYKKLDNPHILELKRFDNIYKLIFKYCNLNKKEKMQFSNFCNDLDDISSVSYIPSDTVKFIFNTSLLNDKGDLIIDESIKSRCVDNNDKESENIFNRLISTFDIKIRPPVENTIIMEMISYYKRNISHLNSSMLNKFYANNIRGYNDYEVIIYDVYEKHILPLLNPNDISQRLDMFYNIKEDDINSDRLQNSILQNLLTTYSFISIIKILNDKVEGILEEN